MTIECTSSPREQFGAPHQITLHPDWQVETLHDLDAERVGRSLGGWCSCLHFTDRIIPAYREALHIMADPGQLPHSGTRWGNIQSDLAQPEGWKELEFSRFPHTSLGDALRSEISPQHLLALGCERSDESEVLRSLEHRMYSALFARAGQAWADCADSRQVEGGAEGFYALWLDGIPTDKVDEIARAIPKTAWPLPTRFYRLSHLDSAGSWLFNAVELFPEREFALWAASQEWGWDRTRFATVWRLSELDISTNDAVGALEAEVPIKVLSELAARPGVGGSAAARWLTKWSRLGVTPSVDHYRLLEGHRALNELPARWVLDSTTHAMRKFGSRAPSRDELAIMLALTNSTTHIEMAIASGVRAATDIRFMEIIHEGNPN